MTSTDVHMGRQKVPKSDFQSQFSMSKIIRIFLIFSSLKTISLEKVFCYCHFLKTSIFEPLCFLKWCPIFDGPCEHLWKSNQKIIFILQIFFLKSTPCWLTSAKLHQWGHTNVCNYDNKWLTFIKRWVERGRVMRLWRYGWSEHGMLGRFGNFRQFPTCRRSNWVTRLGLWRLVYHSWHKLHFYKKIKCCKMVFWYL